MIGTKETMRKFFSGLVLLTALVALASCNDDNWGGNASPKNKISFALGEVKKAKTRSDAAPVSFALDGEVIDGKAVSLTQEVTVMGEPVMDDAMGTRGTPVFTENFKDVFSTFTAPAVFNGTTRRTDLQGDFAWESTTGGVPTYSKQYSDHQQWPESGNLLYFLEAPVTMPAGIGDRTYNATDNTITFSVGTGYPTTGAAQNDILFTSRHIEVPTSGVAETQRILFYHVFSGVKFKIKDETAKNGNVQITSIQSVELSGLINQGTCTITPSYEGKEFNQSNQNAGTDESDKVSVWTYGDTPSTGTFSQTFETGESTGKDLTGNGSYPTSFTGNTANQGKNVNAADASKTFYLIPQTLSDDVKLTITYTFNDGFLEDVVRTATIDFGKKLGNLTWLPGKLYTYTLSIGDKVDVDIDDAVDADTHVKSGLTITNTASATSYMRVVVIGNWVYDGDETVTEGVEPSPISITPVDETSFRALVDGAMNNKWFKATDGYYYYRYPVAGGKTIQAGNTLFSTLELNSMYTDHKPYQRCHLEVTIAVQAVRASDVATAWGSTIADELESTAID